MPEAPNLNRLRYFTSVVEAGSFTAAAARLGLAKTVVSHQVMQLEDELRIALLVRTTRKLQLTESGRWFYERAAALLRDAAEAFGEASQGATEPTGTLSITAPIGYGEIVVAPVIGEYLRRFPLMSVDVRFDDTLLDLIATNVDVAIRLGWLPDSSHPSRRLGSFRQALVCTPEFARTLPRDLAPKDLEDVPWIANRLLKRPLDWTFSRGRERVAISARAIVWADMTPATLACVIAGAGVTVLPDCLVHRAVAEGRLVRLLPGWTLPEGGIHAVYPAARFRPAKVRCFIEMLIVAERKRAAVAG